MGFKNFFKKNIEKKMSYLQSYLPTKKSSMKKVEFQLKRC